MQVDEEMEREFDENKEFVRKETYQKRKLGYLSYQDIITIYRTRNI